MGNVFYEQSNIAFRVSPLYAKIAKIRRHHDAKYGKPVYQAISKIYHKFMVIRYSNVVLRGKLIPTFSGRSENFLKFTVFSQLLPRLKASTCTSLKFQLVQIKLELEFFCHMTVNIRSESLNYLFIVYIVKFLLFFTENSTFRQRNF